MNRLAEIIETYINGNITIAKNEFSYWKKNPIQIVQCSEIFGIRQTIKILKAIGLSDMHIINSFHDYDRQNIDEAKEILLNNFYYE
jgi:hypothetical protein|tara:strand:- start:6711 stop:6968 length:258 start_codon:yes stop_codon:yes gene_type:complete